MAITGIGGYRPITNTNTSSSRFSIPEFPDSMTTKGQSKLSKEETMEKLMEMARRNVANGTYSDNPYRINSAEWLKMEQEYVSCASPDRKGIINNTLSGLGKKLSLMMPNFNRKLNLLELLMQNSRLFGTRDIGNNFINFRDAKGTLVAAYCQQPNGSMGFTEYPTDAELSRSHEFMQMTYDARVRAAQEAGEANTAINGVLAGFPLDLSYHVSRNAPMDMAKLAAYGITYDTGTGQTNVDKEKLQQATGRQIADKPTVGWIG